MQIPLSGGPLHRILEASGNEIDIDRLAVLALQGLGEVEQFQRRLDRDRSRAELPSMFATGGLRIEITGAVWNIAEIIAKYLFPVGQRGFVDIEKHNGRFFCDFWGALSDPGASGAQRRRDVGVIVGAAVVNQRVGEDADIDRGRGIDRNFFPAAVSGSRTAHRRPRPVLPETARSMRR